MHVYTYSYVHTCIYSRVYIYIYVLARAIVVIIEKVGKSSFAVCGMGVLCNWQGVKASLQRVYTLVAG